MQPFLGFTWKNVKKEAKVNKILMRHCKMCADSNKNMVLGSNFDQYKAFERD
jgi:hypothetical protein